MKKLTKLGRITLFQLKFDLKMKLTTFLLIVSLFQIHANNSYGQKTKITLNLKNISLEETLNEIEALSEFKFMYNDKNVDYKKIVSINARNKPISKILDKLFSNTSILYEVLEKQIILKPRPIPLSKPLEKIPVVDEEENLQYEINGRVTDENGLALPGVSIVILGTINGTATDFDGNYTIEANQGDVLEFSYLGMENSQATVGEDTTIDMTLISSTSTLNEVVLIGYGTRRRKDLTGSIGVITSEELTNEVKMTAELAIQGKMSGVFVSNPGADPNARPTIRIRGVGTLGFNDPLYVIDGVPITEANAASNNSRNVDLRGNINIMNLINPEDIESISVLKDASATAIYGVRASNGVILIQTKRGRAGKTRVTFSQSYGVQSLRKRYDVLNTSDYVALHNEAWTNNTAISRGDNPFGALYDPSSPDYLGNNATYNWIDSAVKNSAAIQNYNIGISGGSDKSNFAVNVGYTNQESVIFSTDFERYSFSINSDHKINKWLKLGQSYRMALSRTKREPFDGAGELFLSTTLINPWQPLYDSSTSDGFALPGRNIDGSFTPNGYGNSTRDNFLGASQYLYHTRSLIRNLGSFYAEITPLKNVRLRGTYSVDNYSNEYDNLSLPENSLYSTQGGNLDSRGAVFVNRRTENLNLVAEFLVGYANSFGKHNVDLIFNAMDQKTYWKVNSLQATNTGITSFDQRQIPEGLDPGLKSSFIERSRDGLQGYMGRLSYNYDSRYYVDGTVRRDGSSKFGPGYKWGTFPAIGVAWRVSSEKFMGNATWLDDLKFRAGWGQTGNQETKPFGFLSLINNNPSYALGSNGNPGEGILNPAIALGDFPIIDTTWETSTSINVGFDATMFDNSISFTAEYYEKDTEGILQQINIPQTIGALNSPVVNLANVINKGFEFQLGYTDQYGEIGFNVNFNFTTIDNNVTKLYNNSPQGSDLARVEVGYPIGYIYGYKTDGIFQTQQEVDTWLAANSSPGNTAQLAPGDFIFQDLYGEPTAADGEFAYRSEGADNVVNQLDRTYLGKTIPGYYYGLSLGADYNGFDIGLTFRGVGDVQKVNFERISGESIGIGGSNFFTSVQNRWTPTNPSNTFPRAVADDPSENNRLSDRWVEDADFFRLQNLQLGYSFGDQILEGFGASNFRIYASLSNVFVITPYSGLDPEHDTTPTTMTLGFNIGF